MGIRAELQEALPDMFEVAGEDAVFTPAAGAPVDCKVFIDFDVALEPDNFEGQTQQTGTVIEALLNGDADLPDGIAISRAPVRGETFTLAGVTYSVARIMATDGFTVKMAVK
jgi:hypothetical protein